MIIEAASMTDCRTRGDEEMTTLDRDGILVPNGYPAHLILDAREKADHVRPAVKACPLERVEHLHVVNHLRSLMRAGMLTPDDVWATMNESRHVQRDSHGKMRGADLGAAKRDRKMGLHSGVSDIIIGVPFVHRGQHFSALAIEMKRGRRSLSDLKETQRAWLGQRRVRGWVAEFTFGAREAIELLHACYGW